jgi:CBS domain-containing protein
VVVHKGEPVRAAIHPMVSTGEECAIAVDEKRRPSGVLTSHDVVRHAPTVVPATLTTRDIGKRVVVTVTPGQTVGTVIDTMRAHNVRHVVVVMDERPTAIVSWRNLVEIQADKRRSLRLSSLPLAAVHTAHDGTRVHDVCEAMVSQKIGCLPIVDADARLVGIVSRTDVLAEVLRHLPA